MCYWSMEKQFSEVRKLSDSFIYGLYEHYNYGWLYICIT